MRSISILLVILLSVPGLGLRWGFFGHKTINRLAVFSLPPEMIGFYKHHIQYITENSVNPDRRRYAVEGEAPRHYIDLEAYGDSALYKLPRRWENAVTLLSEDTLMEYGIVPWHVYAMKNRLTAAMRRMDPYAILRVSADLGHYVADANVPLHTTINYNGQFTNQKGIHGFWESRLPELYSTGYDFFVGKASYIDDPQRYIWGAVTKANMALDSVLGFERKLTERFTSDKKYSYEQRGARTVKVYSRDFSKAYHDALKGQVERRMKASIKMVADFWYTCWIDAGQPDLNKLLEFNFTDEDRTKLEQLKNNWKKSKAGSREHQHGDR